MDVHFVLLNVPVHTYTAMCTCVMSPTDTLLSLFNLTYISIFPNSFTHLFNHDPQPTKTLLFHSIIRYLSLHFN